ncbi:hypothetical protein [Altibacter sp. HG106]|uniref:hypothetical protein n=1 Tax=Altibacter sp. HG106 TaxID=3023937 RepID=UPI0023507CBE|nr:hypothetical protein [Altibacter sp. HG106]MDC7995421.1 hypothetical protein [Altibacter sp. HG106]
MSVSEYIISTAPISFVEIVAALCGIYYFRRNRGDQRTKYFVIFLWITAAVDILGAYAPIAYFSDYAIFGFVEKTPFRANYWLFNIYVILMFSFYSLYFSTFLRYEWVQRAIRIGVGLFVIAAGINLSQGEVFFSHVSPFSYGVGSLLTLFVILLFYFELLRSNIILHIRRYLPMYVSVGVMAFILCITPLEFYSGYFNLNTGNDQYVELRNVILMVTNIFMYSVFSIGFIICSRRKRSY